MFFVKKKLFFLLFIWFFFEKTTLIAQEDSTDKQIKLQEVTVSASKFEQPKTHIPNQILALTKNQIALLNTNNTAQLLEQTGGVFVQRSQAGGGSPVLRGFEGNKILLVVDGVRLNNAIFRSGHLQNILRIDQAMLDKLEVIFGPSSVLYGSDALGGVINLKTKKAIFNKNTVHGFGRYNSAFSEQTFHVDFNLGFKNLASLTSITYSSFGDVVMGKNFNKNYPDFGVKKFSVKQVANKDTLVPNATVYKQSPSGYRQFDFLQKVIFMTKKIKHEFNIQFSSTGNVPRYDRLSVGLNNQKPVFTEWNYGPEIRSLGIYSLELPRNGFFDKGNIVFASQWIKESRISRPFKKDIQKTQEEFASIASVNADFLKNKNKNLFQYGLELIANNVNSVATSKNIYQPNSTVKSETRYPDGGSKMNTIAAYAMDSYSFTPKLLGNVGIRYSKTYLFSQFNEKTFFPFPYSEINQNNSALSGNLSLVYNPTRFSKYSILGSSGFRTPNIDDLAKVYESVSGKIVVPNPNIKPENTYNLELSTLQKAGSAFEIEAGFYFNYLKNIIILDDFVLNGKPSIDYKGINSQIVAQQNKDKGRIQGMFISIYTKLSPSVTLSSTLNTTKGWLINKDKTPLDHIPPMYGKANVIYKYKKIYTEVFVNYNAWKRIKNYSPNGEDNAIYATVDGTPAWNTVNIRLMYNLKNNLVLQTSFENILDTNYRPFSSGITSPGRSFMVCLRKS